MKLKSTLPLTLAAACCLSATSSAINIDFDGLTDLSPVEDAYKSQGVSFSGAVVLTGGQSLNEIDFPPRSGMNVVMDDGGPLGGIFDHPVTSLGGYLTYMEAVTLLAYDDTGTLLGSVSSLFSENSMSSGNTPNELLSFSSPKGIKSFVFAGSASGNSFVLDDFFFDTVKRVPDAGGGLALMVLSIAGLGTFCRCHSRRSQS